MEVSEPDELDMAVKAMNAFEWRKHIIPRGRGYATDQPFSLLSDKTVTKMRIKDVAENNFPICIGERGTGER